MPSLPDTWALWNCYPSIHLALQQATPADTIVLYPEDHVVDRPLDLITHLANKNFDGDYATCRVLMETTAAFRFDSTLTSASIQGVSFVGSTPASSAPVLYPENPTQTLQSVLIEDCAFTGHQGSSYPYGGSCIHARGDGQGMQIVLRRSVLRDNTTAGPGGAVFLQDDYHFVAEDCEFTNNESQNNPPQIGRGGAISVFSLRTASSLDLAHCHVDSNRAVGAGGGISVEDGSTTLHDCDLIGNRSAFSGQDPWTAGAGLFMSRTSASHTEAIQLDISDSRFIGNKGNLTLGATAADGGGVLVKGRDVGRMVAVTCTGSLFEENYNGQGAGFYLGRYATGLISRCTFRNNTSFGSGGAAYKGGAFADNLGETGRFEYCQFIGNQAGYDDNGDLGTINGRGGAFRTRLSPRAEFIHCSFSNNRSGGTFPRGDAIDHTSEGSAFTDSLQMCVLVNCVFYGTNGNTNQITSDPSGFSEVSHCAYEDGEFSCAGVTPDSTVILTESPFVSAENPYPIVSSPCISRALDVGISPDILGTVVPQGAGPDIGAYEFVPSSAAPGTPEIVPVVGYARILPARPNPFRSRTTIVFELGRRDHVRLRLVDSAGRVVAPIAEGDFGAGRHRIDWGGLAAARHPLATGVYYVTLESSDGIQSTKLLLIR
jgi:hypothetical protein